VSRRTRSAALRGQIPDLPDVNVWLALAVREHVHHEAASQYWNESAAAQVHFCRVSMLGMVRLLTQPRVMGQGALDMADAMALYEHFTALPEVDLHPEPAATAGVLRRLADAEMPARLLTDAYLAAFAIAGGLRLVTFDRDFGRFEGLNLLRLSPPLIAS
jgi:toxin-antitoxin system PIN domain toxin